MNLQQEIRTWYGVRMGEVPADGKMRAFKIDPFRIGFVISLGDCAAFGCWSDGEFFAVIPDGVVPLHSEIRAQGAKVAFEQLIIQVARGIYERNGGLTVEENERLQMAVRLVEAQS